jgi:hypothetical protein
MKVPREMTARVLMDRRHIGYFKAILESYEEVALLTVVDGGRGIVELIYPEGAEDDLRGILEDLKREGILFGEVEYV